MTDADYFPKGIAGLIYKRLARFTIRRDQSLTNQLRLLGYEASQVHTVVLSHLHQDHIGGLREVSQAIILVSADEWRTVDGRNSEFAGILRSHIEIPGLRWNRIVFKPTSDQSISPFSDSYDIFGDESLVLIPTPGHTPGSLSLLIRKSGVAPILLVGDLTYDIHLMDEECIPGIGSRRSLLKSTRLVNQLRRRLDNLVVAAAHDPGAAEALHNALATKID